MRKTCDLMTESCDPKVVIPSNGNWNSVLKGLYVDLFNLIVESRIPVTNERGYGDGCHCPPLMGQNVHLCDLLKPECQKNQRLIHHLLRAVRQNVFEIDVLMLPDCCSESNLSEQIESKEYILLERWSMKCVQRNKSRAVIEIPELLRAVRSFLHFSQISAWFSLTKGKSPANIYYWVKPTSAPSLAQFPSNPEVHCFPVCRVNDGLYGIVKVNYPARKQFIPKLPCSKHPTHELTFRTKPNYQDLTQNIPLNPSVGKQLQNTCDNQLAIITAKQCATDSEPLKPSEPILKTVTRDISSLKKRNRILKHSNILIASQNASSIISNSSSSSQINIKKEKSSNSEITFINKFSANASQENLCLSKETLTSCLSRKDSKLNLLNDILHSSLCERNFMPNETAPEYLPEQSSNKYCDQSPKTSNSEDDNISTGPLLLVQSDETSRNISDSLYCCQIKVNKPENYENRLKLLKRKQEEHDNVNIVLSKKRKTLMFKKIKERQNCTKEYLLPQNIIYQRSPKRKLHQSSTISKKIKLNSINTDLIDDQSIAQKCLKVDFQKSSMLPKLSKLKAKCIETEKSSPGKIPLKQWKYKSNNSFCHSEFIKKNKTNAYIKPTSTDYSVQSICKNQVNTNYNLESYLKSHSSVKAQKNLSKNNSKEKSSLIFLNEINSSTLDVSEENGIEASYSKNISDEDTTHTAIEENEYPTGKKETNQVLLEHNTLNAISHFSSKQADSKFVSQPENTRKWNCNNSFKRIKVLVSKAISQSNRKNMSPFAVQDLYKNSGSAATFVSKISLSKTSNIVKKIKNKSKTKTEFIYKKCLLQDEKELEQHSETQDLGSLSIDIPKEIFSIQNNQTANKELELLSICSESSVVGKETSYSKNESDHLLCKILPQKATSYHDCFPRNKLKFARGKKLLGNFEESILKGCLPSVNSVKGFKAEIGASGSFCPNHITLPAEVSFYDLDSLNAGTSSYMARVDLDEKEYYLPKKGAVQVTLFNPSETVVKMFVLNYDLSDMPPMCHTFIRQKTYYMPIGSTEECPSSKKWLRFVIHLRFASTKTGKVYLHKDLKIIVLNKCNDDAASEFSQEPRELRSFLHVPLNPTFSNL